MKKILKVTSALLIVLLFSTAAHSLNKKDPRNLALNNPAGITYIVEVEHTNTSGLCNLYYVMVTNENGEPIDQPLYYVEGVTTYVFHEAGPVLGTRTAHLTMLPSNAPNLCNQTLNASPSSMTTSFRNGSTYIFNLDPSLFHRDE